MCYAKPGPRCYGHASEKVKNTKAKLDKAQTAVSELEEEARRLTQKHPNTYKDRYDYKGVKERHAKHSGKVGMLKRELRADILEADATTGGIEALEQRINTLNPALENEEKEYNDLVPRLTHARRQYRNKLLKYDYERGTVHGRNPSPYGSPEGLNILKSRKRDLLTRAAADNGKKKAEYEEQAAAVDEQISHAKETAAHAQSRITDYPSATLAGNKEKLKKTTKELDTIKSTYTENEEAYATGPVREMQDFVAMRRKEGYKFQSQWRTADKRAYKELEERADTMYEETVKPYMHRTRQLENVATHLKDQIEQANITPKERAAKVQANRLGGSRR